MSSRLTYIDPTGEYNKRNIEYSYEDYCIAIDLTVLIPDRYSCGHNDSNSTTELHFSFIEGTTQDDETKKFLTTNYTNISHIYSEDNTNECFGIESMSITYNEKLFPIVNIRFIDVKGASLMSPVEETYTNISDKKDMNSSRALYKAFFTLPYPTFLIKYKGFYGKGVTYRLTLSGADIEFNSDTGNFNISANFIGEIYGIYADLPLNYIAIAPFTADGKLYWKTQVENGRFRFRNLKGEKDVDMITFPELITKLTAISTTEAFVNAQEAVKGITSDLDNRQERINSLKQSKIYKDNDKEYVIHSAKTENDVIEYGEELLEDIEILIELAEGSYYNDDTLDFLKKLRSNFLLVKKNTLHLYEALSKYSVKIENGAIKNYVYSVSNIGGGFTPSSTKIKECKVDLSYIGPITAYLLNNTDKVINYICITPNIKKIVDTFENELDSDRKKYKDIKYESNIVVFEKTLGFIPSVRNIYEMVFAHMETFLYCFYKNTKGIKDDIRNGAVRKKNTYGIKDEMTDTPKEVNIEGAPINFLSKLLPPYTGFYRLNKDKVPELVYPSMVTDRYTELKETDFVESLLSASALYIEKSSNDSVGGGGNNDILNPIDLTKFIPTTTYDHINNINPYNVINEYEETPNNIKELILGIFAIRCFYKHLGTYEDGKWYQLINHERALMGVFEAINVYNIIGTPTNKDILNFIKEYSSTDNMGDKINEFFNLITRNTTIWKLDGNTPLFKETTDNKIEFNYQKLPIGTFSPFEIKNENIIHANRVNEKYLNNSYTQRLINHDKEARNIVEISGDTFFYIENVNYFNVLFEKIQNLLEDIKVDEEAIDDTEETVTVLGVPLTMPKLEELKGEARIRGALANTFQMIDSKTPYYDTSIFAKEVDSNKQHEFFQKNSIYEIPFIKYPSYVNKKKKDSIVSTKAYERNKPKNTEPEDKWNTKNRFQAYLFLSSIPIKDDVNNITIDGVDDDNGSIYNDCKNGFALKSLLLREGSYYWYYDDYDNINRLVDKAGLKGGKLSNKNCTYIFANADGNDFETINFNREPNTEWLYPEQCTSSRRNKLKDMFIKWADGEFKTNKKYLEDKRLYNNEKYEDGLLEINNNLSGERANNSEKLQIFLKKLFFKNYIIFDTADSIIYDDALEKGQAKTFKLVCNKKDMARSFVLFIKQLKRIYGKFIQTTESITLETVARNLKELEVKENYTSNDIRLSVYLTLKRLYEKWLCSPHNGPFTTWTLDPNVSKSDFNRFVYLDSFHRNIGDTFIINLLNVKEWLVDCLPTQANANVKYETGSKSVYEFLSLVAEKSGAMLMCVPQKIGGYNEQQMREIFTPIPFNGDWVDNGENFAFMYIYEPSKLLGDDTTNGTDANGYNANGDSFNLTDNICDNLFGGEGEKTAGFAVTYAKQNQSIFKNIRLNTSDAGITDVAIANKMHIASSYKNTVNQPFYGQDIYHINANKSYRCEVECLGDAQITPMMYFQLNNIPFWNGAYMIQRVTHDITPGNAITKFTGVRLSRNIMTSGNFILPIRFIEGTPPVGETSQPPVGETSQPPVGETSQPSVGETSQPSVGETSQPSVNVEGVTIIKIAPITLDRNKLFYTLNNQSKYLDVKNMASFDKSIYMKGGGITHPILISREYEVKQPSSNINWRNTLPCTWRDTDGSAVPLVNFKGGVNGGDLVREAESLQERCGGISESNPLIFLDPAHGLNNPKKEEHKWSVILCGLIKDKLLDLKYPCLTIGEQNRMNTKRTEINELIQYYGSKKVIYIAPHQNACEQNCWEGLGVKNGKTRFDSFRLLQYLAEAAKIAKKEYSTVYKENKDNPVFKDMEGFMGGDVHINAGYNPDGGTAPNCACALTENWFKDYKRRSKGGYPGHKLLMTNEVMKLVVDLHVNGIISYIKGDLGGEEK